MSKSLTLSCGEKWINKKSGQPCGVIHRGSQTKQKVFLIDDSLLIVNTMVSKESPSSGLGRNTSIMG
jgi:hypothetical protein